VLHKNIWFIMKTFWADPCKTISILSKLTGFKMGIEEKNVDSPCEFVIYGISLDILLKMQVQTLQVNTIFFSLWSQNLYSQNFVHKIHADFLKSPWRLVTLSQGYYVSFVSFPCMKFYLNVTRSHVY
jgi:hypothetical protein